MPVPPWTPDLGRSLRWTLDSEPWTTILSVISRYFVIALALGLAVVKARTRAWPETIGLASLGIGLICLRLADTRQQPVLKRVAWLCFAITLLGVGMVVQRDYLR